MPRELRIFFATDIHGSNICFRKFINAAKKYGARILVMGGDVTGKFIVPIVRQNNGRFRSHFEGIHYNMASQRDIEDFVRMVGNKGPYPYVFESEDNVAFKNEMERDRLFERLIITRLAEWVHLADERLSSLDIKVYFNAGNDDILPVDQIIDQSKTMERPEGKVVDLGEGISMISTGYGNLTPFDCPRDISEEELGFKIDAMASRVADIEHCIFNFHCPPYNMCVDSAPRLNSELQPRMTGLGVEHAPAGSKAVLEAINKYKPMLALHGHIHESRGKVKIGRTVCCNPGSAYAEGILNGVVIDIKGGKIGDGDIGFTSG